MTLLFFRSCKLWPYWRQVKTLNLIGRGLKCRRGPIRANPIIVILMLQLNKDFGSHEEVSPVWASLWVLAAINLSRLHVRFDDITVWMMLFLHGSLRYLMIELVITSKIIEGFVLICTNNSNDSSCFGGLLAVNCLIPLIHSCLTHLKPSFIELLHSNLLNL